MKTYKAKLKEKITSEKQQDDRKPNTYWETIVPGIWGGKTQINNVKYFSSKEQAQQWADKKTSRRDKVTLSLAGGDLMWGKEDADNWAFAVNPPFKKPGYKIVSTGNEPFYHYIRDEKEALKAAVFGIKK